MALMDGVVSKKPKIQEDIGFDKEAVNGQERLKVGNRWNSSGIDMGKMSELGRLCLELMKFPTIGNGTFPSGGSRAFDWYCLFAQFFALKENRSRL